jgi:hypothetical protein
LPLWIIFNPYSLTLAGTAPQATSTHTYTLTIFGTDHLSGSASHLLSLIITPNLPPLPTPHPLPDELTFDPFHPSQYTFNPAPFTDPEGLPLTLTIVGIPKNYSTWVTWHPQNRTLRFQPDAKITEGTMNLTIVATDDIG